MITSTTCKKNGPRGLVPLDTAVQPYANSLPTLTLNVDVTVIHRGQTIERPANREFSAYLCVRPADMFHSSRPLRSDESDVLQKNCCALGHAASIAARRGRGRFNHVSSKLRIRFKKSRIHYEPIAVELHSVIANLSYKL